ncbi:hypothetical protein C1H46_012970 [Malus baccata]|uniref:Uncharacterized protein n=1 Tax=Malus baccata TaxID=106549 RepID=A0A540MRF7_MALBA|nr:hypothetical protein C1H46_012970 [Malus baccata]
MCLLPSVSYGKEELDELIRGHVEKSKPTLVKLNLLNVLFFKTSAATCSQRQPEKSHKRFTMVVEIPESEMHDLLYPCMTEKKRTWALQFALA